MTECEYRGHNFACRRCGEWPPGDRRDSRIQELEARVRELEPVMLMLKWLSKYRPDNETIAALGGDVGDAVAAVWAAYDAAHASDPAATEVEA